MHICKILLGIYLGVELLGHRIYESSTLWNNTKFKNFCCNIFSAPVFKRCYLIHLFSIICYHRTSTFANQMGVKWGLDLYFLYYLWGWIPYRPCVLSPLWTAYSWLSPVFLPGLLPYTGLQDRSSLHTFNNDPLLAICVSNIFPSLWPVFSWFINVPHFKAVKFINLSRLMAFVT